MNIVAARLANFASLTAEEIGAVSSVTAKTVEFPNKATIVAQGDKPEDVFFLLEGMLIRYKDLIDGTRQILSILLPGDACDIGVTLLNQRDHSIATVGLCKMPRVSDASIELLSSNYPRVRAALRWSTLVNEAIVREWIVNIGQRDAPSRTAHLFCELFYRNFAIGRGRDGTILLPLTQTELADVLGITSVHMNRVLQELRARDLLSFADGRLTVPSLPRLEDVASFDPSYLHLDARFSEARGAALLREGRAVDGRLSAALIGSSLPPDQIPESDREGGILDGHTVLVVEDDYYTAADTASALYAAGANVLGPYGNEADAFMKILHQLPSVAVLDIGLHGEPAFELARVLREAGIPFIFATGYDRTKLPADLATSPHVLKPFASRELVERVSALA